MKFARIPIENESQSQLPLVAIWSQLQFMPVETETQSQLALWDWLPDILEDILGRYFGKIF